MADLSAQVADSGEHDFLAGRALAQRSAVEQQWQSLVSGGSTPTPEAPAPAPPATSQDLPLGQRLMTAPLTTIGHGIAATASDVGRGIIDAPRQAVGGALDFVNNIVGFADTVVKHAEDAGVPNVYFRLFDEGGKFAPKIESTDDFRKAQAAGDEHIFQVPTTGSPDTVTGQIVRAAVPFVIGRGTSGSAMGALGGSLPGEVARDFASGAISQNPESPRLSNLIDQVAPNAVTDFLKAKPGDEGTVLGRVKSGLEFAGLGALVGGAVRSLKALKSEPDLAALGDGSAAEAAGGGEGAPATPMPAATEGAPSAAATAPTRDILSLGDPLAPAVEIKPTARDAAMAEVTAGRMAGAEAPGATAGGVSEGEPSVMSPETISAYLSGARVDNPVKLNLSRIGSPEDIGDALAQVSRTIPAQAVQSNDATIAAADALGLQPAEFLNGYKGQNLNASETTAMRFMLDSSAEQLIKYAEVARDPLASAEAKAQFLKSFTVHRSLQSYFENARAEAGRTLQAWSIMSQQRSGYTKAIGDMVQNAEGSSGDLGELAEKIASLDNPLQAGRFVAGSMLGNGRDLLLKVWYNSLLSSPTTVVKKLMSDVGMATWNVATTWLAEKFGSNVPEGETGQLLAGYAGSFKDAVRAGGKALQAGESQFYRDYSTWEGQPGSVSDQVARRFSQSMAWNGSPEVLSPDEPTRGAFEFIRSFMPTSWIAGADDFAKVWNYRAELRRLAWRAADGDGDTFSRLMDSPTHQLNQAAFGASLKNTFQEPLGPLGQSISDAVDAVSVQVPHTNFEIPLGRFIAPFTKVPFNIAKTAAENSPLALLMREPQQVLAGGPSAARDTMIARIGLGSGVSLGLADLALNNYLTGKGPSDPSLRREWEQAGNQPYSLQVPGLAPVRLNQIEPFGMTLGAIADTFNILKFSEDEKDFGTLLPSLALGIGNAMLSKTYFEGVARMMDAIEHPDQQGNRWAEGMVAGFAPQILSRLARSMDDWERAHYGYIDSIEEKLPFLRNNLPPQRTLWGDPVPIREGFMPLLSGTPLARVISPMQLGRPPDTAEPIDKWIWDNRSAFPLSKQGDPRGIQKVGQTQVFGQGPVTLSVQLTPQLYDRLQVLAGNELKDPRTGMGTKDMLNSLVTGMFPVGSEQNEWNKATPEARAEIIQHTVAKYRGAAKQQLLSENKELLSAVTDGLSARAAALGGTQPQ